MTPFFRIKRTRNLAGALLCSLLLGGCAQGGRELGYYWQSLHGHVQLMLAADSLNDWMARPSTPPALRQRLALAQRARAFAVRELHLPDNASYHRYADLKRSSAVWNVVAAPPYSLQLHTWCFPVVGCVGYRGYYDEAGADAFADGLRAQGLEVSVYGVPAYSTLGLLPGDAFADPLLNTFIGYPEGELARLIFHELAHQIAYAKGDTVFNESFATMVERLGAERWLRERAGPQARAEYEQVEARRRDFQALTMRYRERFQALYDSAAADAEKRRAKAALLAELRADHAALKRERWGGFSGYDGWFAHANNASFGVLAAYHQLVPNFERLYEREGRDLPRFYAEVKRLAALPLPDRRNALP